MAADLTVYYDGACPVCSREIGFYKTRACGENIAWVDAANAAPMLADDLPRDVALARMHVRLKDGTLVDGAAAFAALWRRTPGFTLLGRIVGFPPVLWLAERAYRVFLVTRRLWR